MITEEEARKKWCPFARTVEKLTDGISFPRNRVVNVPNKDDLTDVEFLSVLTGTTCIASECMAWRWWRPTSESIKKVMEEQEKMGIESPFKGGYCGLAGE